MGLLFLNNTFMDEGEVRISPFDSGLLAGYGLFETMRNYGERVPLLKEHLSRLRRGADLLGIPLSLEEEGLRRAIDTLLFSRGGSTCRIRVTVTAGRMEPGSPSPGDPLLLITCTPFSPPADGLYRDGVDICTTPFTKESKSPLSAIKTTSFLPSLMARREANLRGCFEGIMLNERGEVAECAFSNIFARTADRVATPPVPGSGALPGIIRGALLKLFEGEGLRWVESPLSPPELLSAGEVFLTNSMIEVIGVRSVDGKVIGPAGGHEMAKEARRRLLHLFHSPP